MMMVKNMELHWEQVLCKKHVITVTVTEVNRISDIVFHAKCVVYIV